MVIQTESTTYGIVFGYYFLDLPYDQILAPPLAGFSINYFATIYRYHKILRFEEFIHPVTCMIWELTIVSPSGTQLAQTPLSY